MEDKEINKESESKKDSESDFIDTRNYDPMENIVDYV